MKYIIYTSSFTRNTDSTKKKKRTITIRTRKASKHQQANIAPNTLVGLGPDVLGSLPRLPDSQVHLGSWVERRREEREEEEKKGDKGKVDCPYNAHYSLQLASRIYCKK